LYCNVGDAVVFTVSCRDKYSNKCDDTSNHCVIIECYQILHDNNILISKAEWNGSSHGIFPCSFQSPNEVGKYYLSIGIDNTNNKNSLIKGSNFLLTVNPKIIIDDIPSIIKNINEDEKELINNNIINNNDNDNINIIEIKENKTIELSKLQMTRKRGEDALKRQKKQYELEKEERRKKKAIKRTGGGFLLQYSKDI
jgi:hypothetical protein